LQTCPHLMHLCAVHRVCVWQKVHKYLLSERTNFWRKGKRAFQASKTKEPALQGNWATGQRWICAATHRRSKEFCIPKECWSQELHTAKWSQPPPVSSNWSMTASPEPRVAAILNK
jgi:hypothetical protein